MREFRDISGFIRHMAATIPQLDRSGQLGMRDAGWIIMTEARSEIGHYQGDAGPFVEWAELAESTKADRIKKGYSENDPLLRSGELRNSIDVTTSHNQVVVGSALDTAVWMEQGTTKAPPRSFLGGAAVIGPAEDFAADSVADIPF